MADGYVVPFSGNAQTLEAIALVDACRSAECALLPVTTGAFTLTATRPDEADLLDRGISAVLGRYDAWVKDEPDIRAGEGSPRALGVVRGSPAEVVADLSERVRALADREHHLTLRVSYPGMSIDDISRHMRLLAREVLPALRDLAAPAGREPTHPVAQ